MISTARGTKTWSAAPQDAGIKPLETRMNTDEEKALGGKEIGTVLNEIADPNYVDPAKARKSGKKDLDKDAFFKLMLAQIKYQNPQQPMESHEMAAHLAQFTSLEQLYNVNENLALMRKQQDPAQNFAAVQFIGKSVVADGSQIFRAKGDTAHEVRFKLDDPAQKTTVTIVDSSGKDVRKMQLNNLKKGENVFSWNGVLDDGSTARAGEYNLKFEALDGADKKVNVQTKTSGKVTGVNYTASGPVLLMGKQTLRMSDIRRIEDDGLAAAEANRSQRMQTIPGMPTGMPAASNPTQIGGPVTGPLGGLTGLPPGFVMPEMPSEGAAPEVIPNDMPIETLKATPEQARMALPKPKLMEPKPMGGVTTSGAQPELTSNLNEIATQGSGVGAASRGGKDKKVALR
jgi:flagellar basal-body rod modification protein FlgD